MHAHTNKLFKLSRSSGSGVSMEMGGWVGFWSLEAAGRGWTLCPCFLVLLQSYTKHAAAHPKSIQWKDFEGSTHIRGTRVNLVVVQKAGWVGEVLSKAFLNGFFRIWSSARWVINASVDRWEYHERAQEWCRGLIFVEASWQRKPCGWSRDEDSAKVPIPHRPQLLMHD